MEVVDYSCLSTEHSPNQSPLSTSPSPEQRHSPRASTGMVNEQSLHIIVEPQMDGHRNTIYLINPPTGEIISSGVAEHGQHIEIQPGVIFRVPFPHEHQPYTTSPPMQQQQLHPQNMFQTSYPMNLMPSGHTANNMSQRIIPTQQYQPDMINATCPIHGSPHAMGMQSGNDRLDKRRQKLQKRLRDKNDDSTHCTCTKKQHYSYDMYDGLHADKKLFHVLDEAPTSNRNGALDQNHCEQAEEKDISIYIPPKTFVENPYAIIVTWEESVANNIQLNDCLFELQISNKGNAYRSIFNGRDHSFRALTLHPGTEYFFRLRATWGNVQGPYSEEVPCTTPCTVPERPGLPRIAQKTKSSLTIKWNTPRQDGGSQITSYKLQWQNGHGNNIFTDLYEGTQKQHKCNHKLPPGTPCFFRVQATNKIGDSDYSDVLECLTSAGPPAVPEKPSPVDYGTNFVRLKWSEPDNNGSPIDEYKLEMEDPTDGYGFMVKYVGERKSYCCQNLKRKTTYKFRLSAHNQQGYSRCSPASSFTTLSEAPGKMERPKLNGKPKTNMVAVKWDPPRDTGGEEIVGFVVQIDDGKGFSNTYHGPEHECVIEKLQPGHTYYVRVACESSVGVGFWSATLTVTTQAIAPRDCQPARVSEAQPNCLHLQWDPPCDNGGSQVKNYVLLVASSAHEDFKQVYTGSKPSCSVTELLPGREYVFKLQATNPAGTSPWSPISVLKTAPSVPDAPLPPNVSFKSPTHIRLDWMEPLLRGAEVTSYSVEKLENESFQKIYQGDCLFCEIKRDISPATHYYFRIQALSSVGTSPYSKVFTVETPPSSPAAVSDIKVIEQTSSSCLVQWKHPVEHGSPVHEYVLEATGATSLICTVPRPPPTANVDLNVSLDNYNTKSEEQIDSTMESHSDEESEEDDDDDEEESDGGAVTESVTGSETSSSVSKLPDDTIEFRLTELTADAPYKLRIQAVNGVGAGPFSHAVQFFTKELPPSPPSLTASSTSYHSIKLKWGDSVMKKSLALFNHNLQMQNTAGSFTSVYNGIGTSFTLSKLKELTPYCCRIRSKNDAGEGDFSKPSIFYTKPQPPTTIKDMECKEISCSSVHLSWSAVDKLRNDDVIEYEVQMVHSENTKDFVKVYDGEETNCEVRCLKADQSYQFRIHAVRHLSEAAKSSVVPSAPGVIKGVYSKPLRLKTPLEKTAEESQEILQAGTTCGDEQLQSHRSLSDTQLALVILGAFLLICVLTAAFLKWVMADMQL